MEVEEIQHRVKIAVQCFLKNDELLLRLNAHEQAISHRIAVYLESLFHGYHIDCEYNKHDRLEKSMDLVNILRYCGCDYCKRLLEKPIDYSKKKFRSDIIIHERTADSSNLLAIEIKRKIKNHFDHQKLRALTLKEGFYKYTLGLALTFTVEKQTGEFKAQFHWFE